MIARFDINIYYWWLTFQIVAHTIRHELACTRTLGYCNQKGIFEYIMFMNIDGPSNHLLDSFATDKWANAMCCARLSFMPSSISRMFARNRFATLTSACATFLLKLHMHKLIHTFLFRIHVMLTGERRICAFTYISMRTSTFGSHRMHAHNMWSERFTSVGQVWNQSKVTQLTRAGNSRARMRNLLDTGLKHKIMCKLRRTCNRIYAVALMRPSMLSKNVPKFEHISMLKCFFSQSMRHGMENTLSIKYSQQFSGVSRRPHPFTSLRTALMKCSFSS